MFLESVVLFATWQDGNTPEGLFSMRLDPRNLSANVLIKR